MPRLGYELLYKLGEGMKLLYVLAAAALVHAYFGGGSLFSEEIDDSVEDGYLG